MATPKEADSFVQCRHRRLFNVVTGGGMRDEEVIKAADDKGLAMVFTGTRHFRH